MSSTLQRRFSFAQKAIVRLLDSRSVEVDLHERLSVGDVLQLIAGRCEINAHDSQYFGLSITDNLGHFHWLDNALIVLDLVDRRREGKFLLLTQNVRYFAESIYDIQCASTAKFFFLEVHNQIVRHELAVSEDEYVNLVAMMICVFAPDCTEETMDDVLSHVLPRSHPRCLLFDRNPGDLERRIAEHFARVRLLSIGSAIIAFLKCAELSETYGHRFFDVVDDDDRVCLLAVGSRGICSYQPHNISRPINKFEWRQLDNLYFRDVKFSIELRESKRDETFDEHDEQLSQAFSHPTTQVSTSRRRSSRVLTFNFRCETPLVCRTVWSSCVGQHTFFLDQRAQLQRRGRPKTGAVDHFELSEKLNRLASSSSIGSSLPSLSSLHSTSSSAGTMPSAKIADGSCSSLPALKAINSLQQKADDDRKRDMARYVELQKRKRDLEQRLAERQSELKAVCIEEGNVIGEMPDEIHESLMPGEDVPKLKTRIYTSFSIPEEFITNDKEDKVSQMATDVELHKKIVQAASRLATDKNMNKSVRKKRKKDLLAARQTLHRLEVGLQQMRHSASKPDISSISSDANSWTISSNGPLTNAMTKSCPTTPRGSVPDLSMHVDGKKGDVDPSEIPRRAPSNGNQLLHQRYSGISSSSASSDSLGLGLPPRPHSRKSAISHVDHLDNPLSDPFHPVYENVGYRSTSYRSSYRQAHYPTIQDDQHQRKRAQSAHSIALEYGSRVPCSYSIPMQDATQRFIRNNDDDELTPTAENPQPQRRLPTSVSCSAGLGTASLDRRNLVYNDAAFRASPSKHRVTTFPVSHPTSTVLLAGKQFSSSDLPRFQPPSGRLGAFPPRASLPHYQSSQPSNSSTMSADALQTNPQLEALLSYYKQQSRAQSHPKTATIV